MISYTFKTYIADGREYFIYGENEIGSFREKKKDLPFPEGLMEILYLDAGELEPICHGADHALLRYYNSKDEKCLDEVLEALDRLAEKHLYFELLRLDWRYRIEQEKRRPGNPMDTLPHKNISHIPSNLDTMQRQIKLLFAEVLDVDGAKDPVPKKLAAHYQRHKDQPLGTFPFKPLPLRFESIDEETFLEVLHPKTIYDLIDYSLRECVKREQRMRVCKNCGRWFAITGRSSAEYCDRPIDSRGRTCKDVGSIAQWNRKRSDDDVFKAYRKEYKKRFAWIKAGKIMPEDFYKWSEQARAEKQRCDEGEITLEEYQEWLGGA